MKIKALLVDRNSRRKQNDFRVLNFLIAVFMDKVIHYHSDFLYLETSHHDISMSRLQVPTF